LHGLTQALVTRWVGGVCMQYFRTEMMESSDGLDALARAQWKEVTRPAELARLAQEGTSRLATKEHTWV
jgi:uncharacterized protein